MQVKVLQNAPIHSAILLTCIKRLSVLKTYFWSSFEWPLKTGFNLNVQDEHELNGHFVVEEKSDTFGLFS